MTEILWSDPQDTPGRSISKRGVACAFGPDVTEAFLKKNDLLYVIRSHEMKQNGYDCQHDKKMVWALFVDNCSCMFSFYF
jgi:serine/threonine-protein phosphatase 5